MCGRLDIYLHAFGQLRVDKNKKSWTHLTHYCSPYKPFLLLSVLDHISTGKITRNFIEPSFELTQTFMEYVALLPQLGRGANMAYPFYFLDSSDFWELIPQPGLVHRRGMAIRSMKRLRELYLGARFKEELFPLLQMATSRDKLKDILIGTYFTADLHPVLREQSTVNNESDKYSESLLMSAEPMFSNIPVNLGEQADERIRDQGFRKAIVKLYDHRCALCGIKMRTPEGRTVVDAAHIRPWSESQNDHPTNGMALCKLCHWSFDEGLMSVGKQYQVIVSSSLLKDSNLPGHMMTLSDRPIFKPSESKFWPDQEHFSWHRQKRFRGGT